MDRRRSHPQFRIQEARWELYGGRGTVRSHMVRHQAGLRGWSTTDSKFWLKKMAKKGVDHHDFFGGESDTESLADPQRDEADPPVQAIPVNPVRRVIGAFAQLDVVDLTEEFERRTRIMRTVPYVNERSVPGGHEGCSGPHSHQGGLDQRRGKRREGGSCSFSSPDFCSSAQAGEASFRSEKWRREPTDSQKDSGCHCL